MMSIKGRLGPIGVNVRANCTTNVDIPGASHTMRLLLLFVVGEFGRVLKYYRYCSLVGCWLDRRIHQHISGWWFYADTAGADAVRYARRYRQCDEPSRGVIPIPGGC